jgi:hypothetical protein
MSRGSGFHVMVNLYLKKLAVGLSKSPLFPPDCLLGSDGAKGARQAKEAKNNS